MTFFFFNCNAVPEKTFLLNVLDSSCDYTERSGIPFAKEIPGFFLISLTYHSYSKSLQ